MTKCASPCGELKCSSTRSAGQARIASPKQRARPAPLNLDELEAKSSRPKSARLGLLVAATAAAEAVTDVSGISELVGKAVAATCTPSARALLVDGYEYNLPKEGASPTVSLLGQLASVCGDQARGAVSQAIREMIIARRTPVKVKAPKSPKLAAVEAKTSSKEQQDAVEPFPDTHELQQPVLTNSSQRESERKEAVQADGVDSPSQAFPGSGEGSFVVRSVFNRQRSNISMTSSRTSITPKVSPDQGCSSPRRGSQTVQERVRPPALGPDTSDSSASASSTISPASVRSRTSSFNAGSAKSGFFKYQRQQSARQTVTPAPAVSMRQSLCSGPLKEVGARFRQAYSHRTSEVRKVQEMVTESTYTREVIQLASELRLPVGDVLQVRATFDSFDQNCSSTLNFEEFQAAVTKLIRDHADACPEGIRRKCREHWVACDRDHSGEIDFSEFLRWFSVVRLHEEFSASSEQRILSELARKYNMEQKVVQDVKNSFDQHDSDRSGKVGLEEFEFVLHKILRVPVGVELPRARVQQLWREVDLSHDGSISFEEFLSWFVRRSETLCPYEDFYRNVRRLDASRIDPPAYPLRDTPGSEPVTVDWQSTASVASASLQLQQTPASVKPSPRMTRRL